MPQTVTTNLRRSAVRAGLATLAGVSTLLLAATVPATAATRPPAPTSLAAHGSGAVHWLTWSESVVGVSFQVQQARDNAFTKGLTTYRMRGPGRTLTPYRVSKGTRYYYRVRAVRSGQASRWSNHVTFRAGGSSSAIRVLSYNTMSAKLDGQKHAGGIAAPFSDRRPPMLALMADSGADVIGIQEGAACLIKYNDGTNCYRQVDSIADGLSPKYRLADTQTSDVSTRYAGNYILYGASVAPVGSGGTWDIDGTSSQNQTAAYQTFRVVSSGATFLFVTTHLITGSTLSGDKARAAETATMVKRAKAYAANHGVQSIVYVGDFNSYYGEWHVQDLTGRTMRNAHIPDSIEVAASYYRSQYDSINALYRTARHGHGSIDHIYASVGVGVKGWGELLHISGGKFVGTIPSDHNPIYAGLAIPY